MAILLNSCIDSHKVSMKLMNFLRWKCLPLGKSESIEGKKRVRIKMLDKMNNSASIPVHCFGKHRIPQITTTLYTEEKRQSVSGLLRSSRTQPSRIISKMRLLPRPPFLISIRIGRPMRRKSNRASNRSPAIRL